MQALLSGEYYGCIAQREMRERNKVWIKAFIILVIKAFKMGGEAFLKSAPTLLHISSFVVSNNH